MEIELPQMLQERVQELEQEVRELRAALMGSISGPQYEVVVRENERLRELLRDALPFLKIGAGYGRPDLVRRVQQEVTDD